jgi:hypothetical protein
MSHEAEGKPVMLTFALEGAGQGRKEQLVLHEGRLRAPGDPRLHVVSLHPFCQPAHIAVAVQRIRAQSTKQTYILAQT